MCVPACQCLWFISQCTQLLDLTSSTTINLTTHNCACGLIFSLQDEWTALALASMAGHIECVKVLLDRGAQHNHQNKVSAVKDWIRAFGKVWW